MSIQTTMEKMNIVEQGYKDFKKTWKRVKIKRGPMKKKMDSLLDVLVLQCSMIQERLPQLQQGIQARDETIMALGEKLADLSEKKSKPFYVTERDRPELARLGEESCWNKRQSAMQKRSPIGSLQRLAQGEHEEDEIRYEDDVTGNCLTHLQLPNSTDDLESLDGRTSRSDSGASSVGPSRQASDNENDRRDDDTDGNVYDSDESDTEHDLFDCFGSSEITPSEKETKIAPDYPDGFIPADRLSVRFSDEVQTKAFLELEDEISEMMSSATSLESSDSLFRAVENAELQEKNLLTSMRELFSNMESTEFMGFDLPPIEKTNFNLDKTPARKRRATVHLGSSSTGHTGSFLGKKPK